MTAWRPAALLALLLGAWPSPASAHTTGGAYILLLPTRLVIAAGVTVVAVSFIVVALIPPERLTPAARWARGLGRVAHPAALRLLARGPSLVALAAAGLLVSAGALGSRDPLGNPLPLFVWTVWWIGLTYAHAGLGNLWSLLNPRGTSGLFPGRGPFAYTLPTGSHLGSGPMPILSVRNISVRFGGVVALDDVSFDIEARQIVGLIGPNGAGKTTLFNCLSRLYQPTSGAALFEGQDLLGVPPHRIAGLGIGRTFQNLALFATMTVLDNVMVGAHCRTRSGFLSNGLRLPAVREEERVQRAAAAKVIRFMGLEAIAHLPVAGLSFATLKRVEAARALAARPKLLLLDEPAGGLNHEEVETLGTLIKTIREALGITILLVEHHMNLVMQVSDKVVVLDFGRRIAEGTPAEVQRDPEVIKAYLGE